MLKSRRNKIEKHLPGLLIPDATDGCDPKYQKTRRKIEQFKRDEPAKFNGILDRLEFALLDIDIFFNENGDLDSKIRHKKI